MIFGISLGYSRENNYTDLSKVNIEDIETIGSSGNTSRITQKATSARTGNYAEFDEFASNMDVLWVPDTNLLNHLFGIDFFGRYSTSNVRGSLFQPGICLLLLKAPGAYTQMSAGIVWEKNATDNKTQVGFVAGYNF